MYRSKAWIKEGEAIIVKRFHVAHEFRFQHFVRMFGNGKIVLCLMEP